MTANNPHTNSFNDSQWVFSLRFTFDLMPAFFALLLYAWWFVLFSFFLRPKHVQSNVCSLRIFRALWNESRASKLNHLLCVSVWMFGFIVCAARERTWISLCKHFYLQCFPQFPAENARSSSLLFTSVCIFGFLKSLIRVNFHISFYSYSCRCDFALETWMFTHSCTHFILGSFCYCCFVW